MIIGRYMKKIISIIVVLALALAAFLWFKPLKENKPLGDILIVGTSADFPPFSFRASDDSITGFDIDIIKEIAQRLSMKIDLQDKPFSALLPQIELGQIHVIAAGMTPTAERAKRVTFTKPYLSGNPLLIVTRAADAPIAGIDGLKGKELIVNTGYTSDFYLTPLPDIRLLRLPKVSDALTALEQGKADAFVTASFTIDPYVKEGDVRFKTSRLTETDEQSALGISKYLPASFVQRVQDALDAMQADGTLDALKKKWKLV